MNAPSIFNRNGSSATQTPEPPRPEPDFSAEKYTVPAPPAIPAQSPAPRQSDNAGQNPAIREIQDRVRETSQWVSPLREEMARVIVGQDQLVDRLMVGLITNGHILLEGVPGLAKTLALKTLSSAIGVDFSRLQFTPDMLPADIVGTMIYNPNDGTFSTKRGPVFSNLVLADEINRAPGESPERIARSDAGAPGHPRR